MSSVHLFVLLKWPHLRLEVVTELLPGQLVVGITVDLCEDVDGSGSLLSVDELHVEDEGGAPGDDVARALLAVAQLGRDDQLALLAGAHAQDALLPALDHLKIGRDIMEVIL